MARLTAQLLVRVGLVMLVLGVWGRLLPMPNRADVMADEFAIAVSLVLVLTATVYLRLNKDAPAVDWPGTRKQPMSMPRTGGKETH